MVIKRAKFDARTSSSFRGVKTDTQTDRIALYSRDYTTRNAMLGWNVKFLILVVVLSTAEIVNKWIVETLLITTKKSSRSPRGGDQACQV